jgi:factor associated with neutral sphingomyelinase activation
LRIQREALEGEIVSANLHKWIDLIFGYQQKGEEAIEANNLFHPLSYEGSVDIEKIEDEMQRVALEMQIMEFGQTPKQLFIKAHPAKYSYEIPKPVAKIEDEEEKEAAALLEAAKKPKVAISAKEGAWLKELSKKKAVKSPSLHKKKITFVQTIEGDTLFVTGSKDGTAKIFSTSDFQQKKVLFAKEAGARCGTLFRTEKIIAVRNIAEIHYSSELMTILLGSVISRMLLRHMKWLEFMMTLFLASTLT